MPAGAATRARARRELAHGAPARALPCAKIFTIFEGTSEIQRMLIGRAVTGVDVR
ncbi:MAG TPA: acyl-CoA dehydrogenase family protein [Trebonia sp.]